uniref:Conotoxin Reg12f n=2 Tax=Conus regius TaxID=101314 RepID=CM3CF_CONRE|nr:RecName: Full=Conotoxin Reg12f [Conus regius]
GCCSPWNCIQLRACPCCPN